MESQPYCTMLCGYFHSGPETRAHLSDCVNEQYRGLRAIYVCNRHGWLRAVSEYNSGSVCGSLSWTSTEHRLRTAGFRLLNFFKFQKCCFYVYCSALSAYKATFYTVPDMKTLFDTKGVNRILSFVKEVNLFTQIQKLLLILLLYH